MLLVSTARYAELDVGASIDAVAAVAPKTSRRTAALNTHVHALQLLRALLLDPGVRRAGDRGRAEGSPAAFLKERAVASKLGDWVVRGLNAAIRSRGTHPTFYIDTVVPMLRNVAFKGREADMLDLMAALEDAATFLKPAQCVTELLGRIERKSKVASDLEAYEARTLWPRTRAALDGVLADRALDFGSTPFVVAFAFSLFYCLWIETKATVLKGVVCGDAE